MGEHRCFEMGLRTTYVGNTLAPQAFLFLLIYAALNEYWWSRWSLGALLGMPVTQKKRAIQVIT
jgi:hypothetical protein